MVYFEDLFGYAQNFRGQSEIGMKTLEEPSCVSENCSEFRSSNMCRLSDYFGMVMDVEVVLSSSHWIILLGFNCLVIGWTGYWILTNTCVAQAEFLAFEFSWCCVLSYVDMIFSFRFYLETVNTISGTRIIADQHPPIAYINFYLFCSFLEVVKWLTKAANRLYARLSPTSQLCKLTWVIGLGWINCESHEPHLPSCAHIETESHFLSYKSTLKPY